MTAEFEMRSIVEIRNKPRLVAEFILTHKGFQCEWTPDVPKKLTAEEIRRYKEARNAAVKEVNEKFNAGMLVIDV